MDTNLLRSWLGLPPGPWPPDDRVLLGLADGPADPAEAERRALEQMGRLRPHQLVHPELVTEGMNRLAQALLAVTADAAIPPRPPVAPTTVPPLTGLREEAHDAALERPQTTAADDEAPEVVSATPVLLAEPLTPVSAGSVAHPAPPPGLRPSISVPVVAAELHPVRPVDPWHADRRKAYRELAGLRSLLRAWDQLRPSVADPSAGLDGPGAVFEFLEAVQEARKAIAHSGLNPILVGETAPLVSALVRQPLPLAVFRSLVPAQRQKLARDWAAARTGYVARTASLRAALKRSAPSRTPLTTVGLVRTIARSPEWGLLVATGLIFGAVVVRMVVR
jgi:hypothetical protein